MRRKLLPTVRLRALLSLGMPLVAVPRSPRSRGEGDAHAGNQLESLMHAKELPDDEAVDVSAARLMII